MSKKYVLIPLRTFKEICSNVRKNGDTVTGVVKNLDETKEQSTGGQHSPLTKPNKQLHIYQYIEHHKQFGFTESVLS